MTIEKHRKDIRARVSTISSRCSVCIQNNTDGITVVRPIAELHHIFGRASRNEKDVRESIFGVMGICNPHHKKYPPLLSVREYERNKDKWDSFFEAYWSFIGTYDFLSKKERELRDRLFDMNNKELVEFFVGGNSL